MLNSFSECFCVRLAGHMGPKKVLLAVRTSGSQNVCQEVVVWAVDTTRSYEVPSTGCKQVSQCNDTHFLEVGLRESHGIIDLNNKKKKIAGSVEHTFLISFSAVNNIQQSWNMQVVWYIKICLTCPGYWLLGVQCKFLYGHKNPPFF